ncbi:MAG: M67 family metallopeptidase [Gemmatales bacterium]|nr:M67 family metallopeptidase [Gemmatales bacterium]MDW7995407.1 M67 family metallopeptidase [Gemmatales bacterium]
MAAISPSRLWIPIAVWRQICVQAVREWPNECLGMLVGTSSGHVRAAYELVNALAHPHRFLSEPASLFAAERRRRQEGWDLLGFYHSHPGGRPVPSHVDTDPEVNYWLDGSVVSVIVAIRSHACDSAASIREPVSELSVTATEQTPTSSGITATLGHYSLQARAFRLFPHRWEELPLALED